MENKEFADLQSGTDFGNINEMLKDCWLFLTDDTMPKSASIKRDAFNHEVGSIIESCRQHHTKEKLTATCKVYDQYIEVLIAEINELIGFAHAHGGQNWRSSHAERGQELRQKIAKLKNI